MEDKVLEKVEELIKQITEEGISMNNIEMLYKLSKIKHMAKEDKSMNYGNYGAYGNYGRGGYGNYGEGYGRRGYDTKYRGDEQLEKLSGDYGRYMESRSYGAGKESNEAYRYMTESLKDFTKYLFEIAETPQQQQMLREALQQSMM
jgi:hypothetical protein